MASCSVALQRAPGGGGGEISEHVVCISLIRMVQVCLMVTQACDAVQIW